jgi:methylmalonyl-CoA carboxyltransferase large subunit
MNPEAVESTEVMEALDAIRADLRRLSDRVAALEAARPAPSAAKAEPISEELIATISAAIAAYLGKKPHIRQIRVLGGASWAQQGRVSVQASHELGVRHH